jgi:transcription elongation factor Elf1
LDHPWCGVITGSHVALRRRRQASPSTNRQPTKETTMKAPSRTASESRRIICPFCESGELISLGPNLARCDSCGLPLVGSMLETLRDVIGLHDALGAHPCECGHPEMRELPDRVFHCPACGSEVLPMEASSGSENARLGSV